MVDAIHFPITKRSDSDHNSFTEAMGRSKNAQDGGSTPYSVVRMPGFNMDLHRRQHDLIFSELNASRQKLTEENQMLRDELVEAKMIIRLLKMKLDERESEAVKTPPVNTKDTTVRQDVPASYIKAMERNKKKGFLFKQKTLSKRNAFLNPRPPPGGKTFSFRRRRSHSPPQLPQLSGNISPRNTFSPIVDDAELRRGKNDNISSCSESRIEEVATRLEKTKLKN